MRLRQSFSLPLSACAGCSFQFLIPSRRFWSINIHSQSNLGGFRDCNVLSLWLRLPWTKLKYSQNFESRFNLSSAGGEKRQAVSRICQPFYDSFTNLFFSSIQAIGVAIAGRHGLYILLELSCSCPPHDIDPPFSTCRDKYASCPSEVRHFRKDNAEDAQIPRVQECQDQEMEQGQREGSQGYS